MIRSETVIGAIGGLGTGYVLWLAAISIGDYLTTASRWSLTVLILSAMLAVCAGVGGEMLRRRGNPRWAAFAVGLPILPVVLTLAVMANIYL